MPSRRNYLTIFQDGRTRLQSNAPINNFNSQGITKGYLDVLSIEMEKLYDNFEFLVGAFDPSRSTGSNLDKIGFLLGENRSVALAAADYSTTNFYFYIDTRLNWDLQKMMGNYTIDELDVLQEQGYITLSGGTVTQLKIPQGTLVSNSNQSISYSTINDAFITSASTSVYVGVVASSAGPASNVNSNVLITNNISSIPQLRKISNFIRNSNRYPIQNGRFSFNDDQFRYQISTSKAAKPSNEISIRRTALSVPGVRDIMFEKNKYGNGTVNLIVDGTSPLLSQGLIDTIKERVQLQASYGDTIFVSAPEYVGVEISFNIIVDPTVTDSLTARNNARNAIISYINDLPIGGEIVWNQLISEVFKIPGTRDFVPNYFKLGNYDSFNKINRNQIVLRYTNQKANLAEKFYTDVGLCSACIAQ